MTVSSRCLEAIKRRRRTLAGRTGCGLCGTDSLAQAHRALPAVPATAVAPAALATVQRGLRRWQAAHQLTGASHPAAWCATDGAVLTVRENFGRHNALDKLICAMARTQVDGAQGLICITSRAGFQFGCEGQLPVAAFKPGSGRYEAEAAG